MLARRKQEERKLFELLSLNSASIHSTKSKNDAERQCLPEIKEIVPSQNSKEIKRLIEEELKEGRQEDSSISTLAKRNHKTSINRSTKTEREEKRSHWDSGVLREKVGTPISSGY